jgi:hypothetical protein
METSVTIDVASLDASHHRVLEQVLDRKLAANQQLHIRVIELDRTPAEQAVPPWTDIYNGLSEQDVNRLDQAIRQRANLTRMVE